MHKGFLDKRRRFLNLREMQIENVLPEHFTQSYPKFINLLSRYYEWQDQNNPNELLNHLFATRDINETDITLLSFIEDEFLLGEAYFEGFGDTEAEKRAAANFSNQMFRSKGTKFAIEWFFRSFYGLDAEVRYTKENVFTLNTQSSQIGPDSLRYLTNDELYQTFALLVRVGVPIAKWRDIFKLFAHPAGMYLGAEVSINDAVTSAVNSLMLDSAVEQRANESYTILATPDSTNEGAIINFKVNGTNIPNNTGYIYYHVLDLTTSDSDFVGTVPRLDSLQYLPINDSAGQAVGRFTITTKLDSVEGEGVHSFNVILRDDDLRPRGVERVNLNDVISSYVMTPTATTIAEGSPVTFNVVGTNVPSGGSTTLYYYVQHVTTSDSDFKVAPPSAAAPASFFIRGSTGSFSITPQIDNDLVDSDEQFKVIIQTLDAIKKDSATITVSQTIPPFAVNAIDSAIEGTSIVAPLTISEQDFGDTLTWAITGAAASDSRLAFNTSGTIVATSASQNLVIPLGTTKEYTGPVSGTLTVTNSNYTPTPLSTNNTFTIFDSAPTYSILMNPAVAGEGDTVTFKLAGRNIQDSTFYFYIDNVTTNDLDFLGGRPKNTSREAVSVVNDSGTTNSITFADSGEVVDQNFIAYMYNTVSGGSVLASKQFTIAGITYTLTPNTSSVNEGGTVTFTFIGPDGTYYYWLEGQRLPGQTQLFSQGDFTSGFANINSRLAFNVTGGSGSFSVTLANDIRSEGTEAFIASVSTSPTSGAIAVSPQITINDTSKQEYTMTIQNILEGDDLLVNVASNAGPSEPLFYEISGAAAAKFSSTQIYRLYTGAQTSFNVNLGTSTTNSAFDGVLSGTVTLSRGGYVGSGGTLIDTANFTLSDLAATFTLAASTTTPNEGGTITWTVGGSSIEDGTYYYRVSDVKRASVSSAVSSGTSVINLASTAGITVGMACDNASISGTVTGVWDTQVTMSSPVTSTIGAGTILNFANQSVFDDFTSGYAGSVSVTSNAGAFNTVTAINADTKNDAYTMGLYTTSTGASPVASVGFTTTDATPASIVNILIDAGKDFVYDINPDPPAYDAGVARSIIRFENDGKVYAIGSENPGGGDRSSGELIGTWVSSGPVGNFNISAQVVSGPTPKGTFIGSTGTQLSLSTNRGWYLEVPAPTSGSNEGTLRVDITITDVEDPSNTDTQRFELYAVANALPVTAPVDPPPPGSSSQLDEDCFTENSFVTLTDGTRKEIRLIEVGDKVLGADKSINEVTRNHSIEKTSALYGWGSTVPFVTGAHPFLTTQGWKCFNLEAGRKLHPELDLTEIQENDKLIVWNGTEYTTSTVQNIAIEIKNVKINSLSVTGNDTYIANGFVVHNK